MRTIIRNLILTAVIHPLFGCSYSVVEGDGTQRVVGFVNLRVTPAARESAFAGNVSVIKTIGLVANRDAVVSTFAVGYNEQTTAYLKNNALVVGDTLHPTAREHGNDDE